MEVLNLNRIPVTSSNLQSVGYDSSIQILEIEFHNGGIYQYFGVPEYEFTNLLSAPSKGTYFANNIKNRYRYSKVG